MINISKSTKKKVFPKISLSYIVSNIVRKFIEDLLSHVKKVLLYKDFVKSYKSLRLSEHLIEKNYKRIL